MKKILVVMVSLLLCGCLVLQARAADTIERTTTALKTADPKEVHRKMKVKITAGDHVIHAVLDDNSSAKAVYESLPQTYLMMNLYDREMCYRMGAGSLPAREAENTGYQIGDISYWPPAGSLVILYEQNGEVFEQQPIGHTDDDISFFKAMSDTEITFEKEEE